MARKVSTRYADPIGSPAQKNRSTRMLLQLHSKILLALVLGIASGISAAHVRWSE